MPFSLRPCLGFHCIGDCNLEVNNVPVFAGHGNDVGIASEKRGKPSLINPVLSTCSTGGAITLTKPITLTYYLFAHHNRPVRFLPHFTKVN